MMHPRKIDLTIICKLVCFYSTHCSRFSWMYWTNLSATNRMRHKVNWFEFKVLVYLAYGGKEKKNTGWKFFLNNYINKKEKQGDKAKNQLYKFVAYNIKWKSKSMCVCVCVCVCVKPEFMYGHVCYITWWIWWYKGGKAIRWSWW